MAFILFYIEFYSILVVLLLVRVCCCCSQLFSYGNPVAACAIVVVVVATAATTIAPCHGINCNLLTLRFDSSFIDYYRTVTLCRGIGIIDSIPLLLIIIVR